jgi:UDP-N-acetylglucosamine 2-epimerase (non-hydrolysing)
LRRDVSAKNHKELYPVMLKVVTIFGTRPEAIKLAPVIRELKRAELERGLKSVVCVTAQHRQMLDQVLNLFDIVPNHDLDIMEDNQSPSEVVSRVLTRLEPILKDEQPDWVLVQGDTTTVMAASIAAFYTGARVGHVEAGLRTYNKWQPFPEEINRRIASVVADLHFAPTELAKKNLLNEGIPDQSILVTGNPVIDALYWAAALPFDFNTLSIDVPVLKRSDVKLILVTSHRRENFGRPLEQICLALRDLAARYDGRVKIVYPVHLNPNVWNPVHRWLSEVPNISLIPPLDYLPLVHLMKDSYLVLTDSGGIQEEAPGMGKPVLVLREVTERPEAVEAGTARVVGTDRERIVEETVRLLENPDAYDRMAQALNPYGDGYASKRIVGALLGDSVMPFGSSKMGTFRK